MNNLYVIHCNFCGKRVIIRNPSDIEGMSKIPQAPIPGGAPYLDSENNVVKKKKNLPRKKMLKCLSCGRGVVLNKDTTKIVNEKKQEKIVEEKDNSFGRETGSS